MGSEFTTSKYIQVSAVNAPKLNPVCGCYLLDGGTTLRRILYSSLQRIGREGRW